MEDEDDFNWSRDEEDAEVTIKRMAVGVGKNGSDIQTRLKSLQHQEQAPLNIGNCLEALNVVVERHASPLMNSPVNIKNSYILPTTGRKGLALILNIVEFGNDHTHSMRRNGSDRDVVYLTDLFLQLDYDVFPEHVELLYKKSKSKEEIKGLIRSFKKKCQEYKPSSIFVFVGSHGMQDTIITSDINPSDQPLHLYRDIVYEFSHEKCPELKGKPKIFLIQACQKFDQTQDRWDGNLAVTKTKGNLKSTWTDYYIRDVLICTAAIPGGPAHRNRDTGSWLPYCFTRTMMENALGGKSLQEILNSVVAMLRQVEVESEGLHVRLVPVITSIDFKDLYFSGSMMNYVKNYCKVPNGIAEFLDKGKSKICIVHTLDNLITSEKIRENWRICCFNECEDFVELIDCAHDRAVNVVDVVRNCSLDNLRRLLTQMREELCRKVNKVMFLSSEDELELRKLARDYQVGEEQVKVDFKADLMEWSDLEEAFQNKISKRLEVKHQMVLEGLYQEMLVDAINGRNLFKETLPPKLPYYVGRTLRSRFILSEEILKVSENAEDIFVIQGIERDLLMRWAKHEMIQTSGDFVAGSPTKYVTLDLGHSFEDFCAKVNQPGQGEATPPIHLLKYQEKKGDRGLRWIRSIGPITSLRASIASTQEDKEEKELYLDMITSGNSNQPMCISGGPGTGKSVLLGQIGRILRRTFPDRIIIYTGLSKLIRRVKEIGIVYQLKTLLIRAILMTACENTLGEHILKSKLLSEDILVELLVDGLDEVGIQDMESALGILEIARDSLKSTRLWVTTRSELMPVLEGTLNVLGYQLHDFTIVHQVEFFKMYWPWSGFSDPSKFETFAKSMLNSPQCKVNFQSQATAGIPLQCYLMGEAYSKEAEEAFRKGSEKIQVGTITQLVSSAIKCPELNKNKVMDLRFPLSLCLTFPREFPKLEMSLRGFGEVPKQAFLEMSRSTSLPQFTHRIFAEHCIASFLLNGLKHWDKDTWDEPNAKFLLAEVFKTTGGKEQPQFIHSTIVYFLNSLLSEDALQAISANKTSLPLFTEEPDSLTPNETTKKMACGYGNFINVFKFFEFIAAFEAQSTSIISEEFLLLITQRSSLELVKLGLDRFEQHHEFGKGIKSKLFLVAVELGKFSIVEFLVKEKGLGLNPSDLDEGTKTLLHSCVRDTINKTEEEIQQRKQVMRMLIGINKNLLDAKDERGRTALLCRNADVKLLIELVKLGADPLAQDSVGRSVLHWNFPMSPKQYNSLVSSIPKVQLGTLLKTKDSFGINPQVSILEHMDPLRNTLAKFISADPNFYKCIDGNQGSFLECAVRSGRNGATIRILLSWGLNAASRLRNGDTLLHVAAEVGNVKVIDVLTMEEKLDVNAKNNYGHTPLDAAIMSGYKYGKRFEFGLGLLELDGRSSVIRSQGKTLLDEATRNGNVDTIWLLLHLDVAEKGSEELSEAEIFDFIESTEPLKVTVERPLVFGASLKQIDTQDSYFLPTLGQKGLALILNIVEFESIRTSTSMCRGMQRRGSERDVEYLTDLLIQLDFKLYPLEQRKREQKFKSKPEIQAFIQEFKSGCVEHEPESIIVFIGSHGVYPSRIITSDYKLLDLYQHIVHQFSHDNCPVLKGKPKVFLVQSCQDFYSQSSMDMDYDETMGISPAIKDVLVCNSTFPGGVSMRNTLKGTWFNYCFTFIMMKYALKMKSLQEILRLVEKMLGRIHSHRHLYHEPVPAITSIGFKELYFLQCDHGQQFIRNYHKLPGNLSDFFSQPAKLCVVHTLDSHITGEKIRENRAHCCFYEWEKFKHLLEYPSTDEDIVDVVLDCKLTNLSWMVTEGRKVERSKVILVTSENKLELLQGKGVFLVEDSMQVEDLSDEYIRKIQEILKIKFRLDLEREELKGQLLVDIISGREMFKDTLPKISDAYSEMMLVTRCIISDEIYFLHDMDSQNIFLISGVKKEDQRGLGRMERSTEQIEQGQVTASWMTLDENEHFDKICEIIPNNGISVHLLSYEKEKLWWVRTRGRLNMVRRFIAQSQQELTEEQFWLLISSDSTEPICIFAESGCGGISDLFARIGRSLRRMFPDRIVLFFQFREFIGLFEGLDDEGIVLKFQESVCKSKLGKAVMKSKLMSDMISVELLLNELAQEDAQRGLGLMRTIRNEFKSVRLWLTSEEGLMGELEENLDVLGYTVKPHEIHLASSKGSDSDHGNPTPGPHIFYQID